MKKMTEENLKVAFAGESQAHLKYMAFSDAAEKEKLANIARLFRAQLSEQIHAANHLRTLGANKKTGANLSYRRRDLEVTEMYLAYIKIAEHQRRRL
jgi:rubrerythrin